MTKYLTVICVFFLRDGYFYSFFNGIEKLRQIDKGLVGKFGDKEQFEKLLNYYKVKNEGLEFSQLLFKMPYINDLEIRKFVDNIESGDQNGYIAKYVDFCKWDRYLKAVGSEVEIHDLSFVSFLKKNNFTFEINGKKVKVGEYRFRSISDNICDIIEYYRPKRQEEIKPKKTVQNKNVQNVVAKETKHAVKKKITNFKDNFMMKKAKYAIYCDILSKNFKDIDMKNEIRDRNRKERFLKLQKEFEDKKNDLKKYKDTILEMCATLREKVEANKKDTVKYTPPTINRSTKKTNWRDLEPDESLKQRSTLIYSQRNRYGREDDILSARNISSFDGEKLTETSSTNPGIYRPPPPSSVLKNDSNIYRPPPPSSELKNDSSIYRPPAPQEVLKNTNSFYKPPAPQDVLKNTLNKSEEDSQKSSIYVPPTLRGKSPNNKSSFSSWRKDDSEE